MINKEKLNELLHINGMIDGRVECLMWDVDDNITFVWFDDPTGLYVTFRLHEPYELELLGDSEMLEEAIALLRA